MSPAARRRGKRLERLRADVERGGHAFFTSLWSLAVWLLWLAVRPLGRLGGWFGELPRSGKLLVAGSGLALLVAGAVAMARRPASMPLFMTDEEALARVIRSEIGGGSPQQRLHVAWAARNLAGERGESVLEMACSPCGPQELGRPVSSRQLATEADRALAAAVLAAPAILDPTGGATHFINPVLQDQLAARQVAGYRGRPYERVRRTWSGSYGWEPYYRLGPDLELWGPRRRR